MAWVCEWARLLLSRVAVAVYLNYLQRVGLTDGDELRGRSQPSTTRATNPLDWLGGSAMDTLFSNLSQSIDFLVLGTVATLALSLPFGLKKPLTDGWTWLKSLVEHAHATIQGGFITLVLFAAFYFSGYLLNAAGHALLHRAHFLVIETVATTDPSKTIEDQWVPFGFWWRTIPIIGHFAPLETDEIADYWADATRQFYWDVCDKQSYDDLLGGGSLSELRLLRGAVGLTWILLAACVIALILDSKKYRYWSLSTLATVVVLYSFLIIPSYWDVEYEVHSTIWAGLPRNLDKLTIEKIGQVLPCAKMIAQSKAAETERGKGTSPETSAVSKVK
jgi:hypothetical protein